LRDLCGDVIRSGDITHQSVRAALKNSAAGIALIIQTQERLGAAYLKKLTDRVRYERKKYLKQSKH
jgi:hypothetical protein